MIQEDVIRLVNNEHSTILRWNYICQQFFVYKIKRMCTLYNYGNSLQRAKMCTKTIKISAA